MFQPRGCEEWSQVLLTQGENTFMVRVVEKPVTAHCWLLPKVKRERTGALGGKVFDLNIICGTPGGLHSV